MATLALLEGELRVAEEAYTRAIENTASPGVVQLRRALIRIELKEFEGARNGIAQAKKVAGRNYTIDYAEGLLNFRQARFCAAQEHFQSVLNQAPSHLGALYFYGASQFGLRNF